MWRELVSGLFTDARFSKPAEVTDIERLEAALRLFVPQELRSLLLEANGLSAHFGAPLVWSTEAMIRQNRLFRESAELARLYMPFDGLFFFGADGDGDQFGYRILGGQIRETSWIFRWDHESDDREWFAPGLAEFFSRWLPREP